MRILGIDPGTNFLGWALIDTEGNKAKLVVMGIVDLAKYTDAYVKLKTILQRVNSILEEYKPQEMSIESPFFGKNIQSMRM